MLALKLLNLRFSLFCRGRLVLICSLFPDYERLERWAKRIRFYTWYSRSKNVVTHLEKHQ